MPPNLDRPRETTRIPLQSACFLQVLEALPHAAALTDVQGAIQAVNGNWSELASRIARPEWNCDGQSGHSLFALLPDEDAQNALRQIAEAALAGHTPQSSQLIELGTPAKPLHVLLSLRPFKEGETLRGLVVLASDVTQDQMTRIALLDRERKLRELRTTVEKRGDEVQTAQKQVEQKAAHREQKASEIALRFARNPAAFPSEICRQGCEISGAMFSTLATYDAAAESLRFSAHHEAPDYHRFIIESGSHELKLGEGPAGIAAQNACTMKFDHVTAREDYARWTPLAEQYGYNCIWAFPMADRDGLCAVMQLYFSEPDLPLPVDCYDALTALASHGASLVRAAGKWPVPAPTGGNTAGAQLRTLASDLAEEYSNLLTVVLGHSSLAASEMSDDHAALDDVRAIERAARSAARLTRKLSAISGVPRHKTAGLDLAASLRLFVKQHPSENSEPGSGLALPDAPCYVHADSAAMEMIFEAMLGQAQRAGSAGHGWILAADDLQAMIALPFEGAMEPPAGWDNGSSPHAREPIAELIYAREAAVALGGSLELATTADGGQIILALPRIQAEELQAARN